MAIQGKERIYVSDGSGKPKFIETNQLAKPSDIPDVSGFITKQQADGYYQPKGNYATTTQLADKADKVSTENVSEDTKEIQPNRYISLARRLHLPLLLRPEKKVSWQSICLNLRVEQHRLH